MNMLRTVMGGLAMVAMMGAAACSANDESNESAPGDCPANGTSGAPAAPGPATAAQATSGGSPSAGTDGGSRVASLADTCEGYFEGNGTYGPLGKDWLHITPEGCMIGTARVLLTDGTVKIVGPEADGGSLHTGGTWSGDTFYFDIAFANPGATPNRERYVRITGYEK